MNKIFYRGLCMSLTGAVLLAGFSPVIAATTSEIVQMKACKLAVLEKPKLRDFPMAAVSVYPGNRENHVTFTVRWDGAKGHGNCKVSNDGIVEKVTLKKFSSGHNNSGSVTEQDGFFVGGDGKWHDPSGEVCHSCTPENGFPAQKNHSKGEREIDGFYYDRHTGQWRDPSGEVCHSCTPENGFPRG